MKQETATEFQSEFQRDFQIDGLCSILASDQAQKFLRLVGTIISLVALLFVLLTVSFGANASGLVNSDSLSAALNGLSSKKCIIILYDKPKNASHILGYQTAILAANLLGHFPQIQTVISPIENYEKGSLQKCQNSIYFGTYYNNEIPKEFVEDYWATETSAMWSGYNIWKLGSEKFGKLFGYKLRGISSVNKEILDFEGNPSFFRNVIYKNEIFVKFGEWNKAKDSYFAQDELNVVIPIIHGPDLGKAIKDVEIQHSGTGEVVPYILRSVSKTPNRNNKFFLADIPFSFMHESDRMSVFADYLFDFLQEKPLREEKIAFLRIEDVHPAIDLSHVTEAVKIVNEEQAYAQISLIPWYKDPLGKYANGPKEMKMYENKNFLSFLKNAEAAGNGIVWHGVTHQSEAQVNPFSGVSGHDYEFWDGSKNKPLEQESAVWGLERMAQGEDILAQSQVRPFAWLPPHYHASPLIYSILSKSIDWHIGRVQYYHCDINQGKVNQTFKTPKSAEEWRGLSVFFKDINIKCFGSGFFSQFFPYEIYSDVYGQNLIPENLGNIQPYMNEQVVRTRTVQQVLADAKRNLVLRDVWASVFFHSYLLKVPDQGLAFGAESKDLRVLVKGLKEMGYQFVKSETLMQNTLKNKIVRSPVISIKPVDGAANILRTVNRFHFRSSSTVKK